MYVFKEIDNSTLIESNIVHFTQNLNTSSFGLQTVKIVSGSINVKHWDSLNVLFYTSGSPKYTNEQKYTSPSANLSITKNRETQFLSKYHGYPSSSLISIPSKYYGDNIKQNSFKLIDKNNTDNNGNNPIIIDDSKGNLYSTNSHHSQSTSNASSSDNYVGNIFYNQGLAVITETGSWSGSVKYSDLATNYTLQFDSSNQITTREYNITIDPNEFNHSTNYTLRTPLKNDDSGFLKLTTPNLATHFTGSDFQPYITTINLYSENNFKEPIIQATLPRPIRKSDKIKLKFKIKLDI